MQCKVFDAIEQQEKIYNQDNETTDLYQFTIIAGKMENVIPKEMFIRQSYKDIFQALIGGSQNMAIFIRDKLIRKIEVWKDGVQFYQEFVGDTFQSMQNIFYIDDNDSVSHQGSIPSEAIIQQYLLGQVLEPNQFWGFGSQNTPIQIIQNDYSGRKNRNKFICTQVQGDYPSSFDLTNVCWYLYKLCGNCEFFRQTNQISWESLKIIITYENPVNFFYTADTNGNVDDFFTETTDWYQIGNQDNPEPPQSWGISLLPPQLYVYNTKNTLSISPFKNITDGFYTHSQIYNQTQLTIPRKKGEKYYMFKFLSIESSPPKPVHYCNILALKTLQVILDQNVYYVNKDIEENTKNEYKDLAKLYYEHTYPFCKQDFFSYIATNDTLIFYVENIDNFSITVPDGYYFMVMKIRRDI